MAAMRVGDNGTILHFEEGMQFTTNLVWTKTTSTASVESESRWPQWEYQSIEEYEDKEETEKAIAVKVVTQTNQET
ncbi:unnamed protein product [Onchocerca ochengi]|uniref:Phage protein n=1 Tax=Onchocerca ochengi TaxID=42157 RepID=A0A182ESV5_ONCOC|nr:unnamed protein product [Onchocerca ochengi]